MRRESSHTRGDGRQNEIILGASWTTQSKLAALQDALEVSEPHLDLPAPPPELYGLPDMVRVTLGRCPPDQVSRFAKAELVDAFLERCIELGDRTGVFVLRRGGGRSLQDPTFHRA
jgi:hypothetical protein